MSTNYPDSLDNYRRPSPTDGMKTVGHSGKHDDAFDAIEALEAKVGIDGSAEPNSLDNRVNIIENTEHNVTMYGAIGDGIADDIVAINLAVSAIAANSRGGILFFPPGRYRITQPIVIPKYSDAGVNWGAHFMVIGSGATIEPEGAISAFTRDIPTNHTEAIQMSAYKIIFKDLTIKGDGTTGQVGVEIIASTSPYLSNIYVSGCDTGFRMIWVINAHLNTCSADDIITNGFVILPGHSYWSGGSASAESGNENILVNCHVSTRAGASTAFYFSGVGNALLESCVSEGFACTQDIYWDTAGNSGARFLHIRNFWSEHSVTNVVTFVADLYGSCVIDGLIGQGATNGILVDTSQGTAGYSSVHLSNIFLGSVSYYLGKVSSSDSFYFDTFIEGVESVGRWHGGIKPNIFGTQIQEPLTIINSSTGNSATINVTRWLSNGKPISVNEQTYFYYTDAYPMVEIEPSYGIGIGWNTKRYREVKLGSRGGPGSTPALLFGAGTTDIDTNLYRSAANRLKTDDLVDATTMGVATFCKAGVPSDADWASAPPIGTIAIDTTNSHIYIRTGAATWKKVSIA